KPVSIPRKPALQGWFFHIWAKGYDQTPKIATILSLFAAPLSLQKTKLQIHKSPHQNGGSNN
ncbi:hypothetical protein NOL29_26190, partial [Vibrio parahaemolyticus]|uniref:hypothetical protein n=1 Tax=Vibrio parahaemolyticus TaxID=670 RepID=UPI00226A6BAB